MQSRQERLRLLPEVDVSGVTRRVVGEVVPEVSALHQRNFAEHSRARAENRATHIEIREKAGSMETANDIDDKADKLLSRRLTDILPQSVCLLEESVDRSPDPRLRRMDTDYLRQLPLLWVVDPTDGTGRFNSYSKRFSTSIALVMYGEPVLGVVHKPVGNHTWWANRDEQGAYKDGLPIFVSETTQLAKAAISTAYAWDIKHRSKTTALLDKRLSLHLSQPAVNTASSVLDLLEIADGTVDGHFSYGLKPWDMAAAAFIIKHAGGKITTLDGGQWDPFNDNILATNGLIHDDMLEIINKRNLLFSVLQISPRAREIISRGFAPSGTIFSAIGSVIEKAGFRNRGN